ncbi:MAG: DNA adenine methylase [Dehalococcoidia bacterium]
MTSPFLKWAGGKGKLAARIVQRAPAAFGRYHEPFVGGGAAFFAMYDAGLVTSARLSDSNGELVDCFGMVRDRLDDLVCGLGALAGEYLPRDADGRREYYLERRAEAPDDAVARAARLIFLNRTCYNGLYRVNSRGQFNVPHGRYANPRVLDAPGLAAASEALQGAELSCDDFETACAHARAGDFVYLDPPYYPLSATARFTDYTIAAFGPAEHERLRDTFEDLTVRGVHALLSNSDHEAVRGLYDGRGYGLDVVQMSRAINSVGTKRQPVAELLIDNMVRVSDRT